MWQYIRHDFWGLRNKWSKIQVDKISSKYYKIYLLCMHIHFFFKHFLLIITILLFYITFLENLAACGGKKAPIFSSPFKTPDTFSHIYFQALFYIHAHNWDNFLCIYFDYFLHLVLYLQGFSLVLHHSYD